jgi:glycosyltransferase involved in cell wall biosynthesis
MAAASVESGSETVVVFPGSKTVFDRRARLTRIAVNHPDILSGGLPVYRLKSRLEVGVEVGRLMIDQLARANLLRDAVVLIHNEELLPIVPALVSGETRVAYMAHGIMSQEHPEDAELLALQTSAGDYRIPVAVVSNQQRELLKQAVGIESEVVSLPLQLLVREFRHVSWAPKHQNLIAAAGRAVQQKGFDLLIRAAAAMPKDKAVTIRLYLGHGDSEYETYLEALAKRLSVALEVRDWLPRSQLVAELASVSVLAVPSRFEPLGLVAAEAVAIGLPIVASEVGGLTEIARRHGQPTFAGRSDLERIVQLTRALEAALTDPVAVPPASRLSQWSVDRYHEELSHLWH